MKMTRLEWRYLQRITLDHPYFDTHKLPLTEKEAKAIVEANNTMTGKEFVDSIYAKLGMTRPQERKKQFAWLRSIGELFTVPPIRKIAIVVLVVILMTVFFAATPTGRAIAESAIQYIATLLEDGRLIVNRSDNEASPYSVSRCDTASSESKNSTDVVLHAAYVDSFDTITKITGKTPIILPLPYTELVYTYDEGLDYMDVTVTYKTQNAKIISYQIWGAEALVSTTSTGYTVYDADHSIYYSIENEEECIHCKRILKDSVLTISVTGNYTIEDIIKLLKDE